MVVLCVLAGAVEWLKFNAAEPRVAADGAAPRR
jgi:hypothetical protein